MGSSMLIGFNNDVEYKGRMYHIQTEDHGIKDGHITTIIFFSGQILDSKKISYQEEVKGVTDKEEQKKVIKKCMVDIHREFYKRLFDGQYSARVEQIAAGTVSGSPSEEGAAAAEDTPEASPAKPTAPKGPPPIPKAQAPERYASVPIGTIPGEKQAFRGLIWPATDMGIDHLVAEFLDSAA